MGSGYSMPRQHNETCENRGIQVSRNTSDTSQLYPITPNERRIFLAALKELDFLTLYDNSYHASFKKRDTLIRLDILFEQIKNVHMYKDLLSSEEITIPVMPAPAYDQSENDIYDQNYVDFLKSCVIFLNDFCNAFS